METKSNLGFNMKTLLGKFMNRGEFDGYVKKMIKQRNESCEVYKKAGRSELLENEKKEMDVISAFLPKQLSDEEVKRICQETVKSVGATSMKDMGKIMVALKSKHADTIDFSKVNPILKELLKSLKNLIHHIKIQKPYIN